MGVKITSTRGTHCTMHGNLSLRYSRQMPQDDILCDIGLPILFMVCDTTVGCSYSIDKLS